MGVSGGRPGTRLQDRSKLPPIVMMDFSLLAAWPPFTLVLGLHRSNQFPIHSHKTWGSVRLRKPKCSCRQ